ncbi:hypothetical protein DDZ15_02005 [Rhodohalobacter mucosus]|uniref:Glycosyltransferase subfamily 4-like N-terminal domain-containing protein n=1 Tax=Rhodohalobacter mucosus TaxID=2079485 RepID=A0A316TTP9_9BACT|nr:hypothetical protein DDZ15_02005 [Rhodohalobacter mucosus]
MKILIVSSSFYPMNSPRSFRTTQLVREFARQGHDVTLYTNKREDIHDSFESEFGVTIKNLGKRKYHGVQTAHKNKMLRLFKRAVRRGLNLFFEYPDIELMFMVKNALKRESGYDLMISVAVPHPIHWGAALARTPDHSIADVWVADCGDPYMGQTLDSFNKMFYFSRFEKSFCRKAEWITVPIEEARDGYYPEFRDKIRVIPQGFDFNEVDIDHEAYQKKVIPTFAYAGGLIPGGRDPSLFLDYLTGLDRDYKFILYTKNIEMVKPWLEKSDGKIEVRDYIPRAELLNVLSGMDFLVNFENRSSLMSPSKLIDYYLTGRPVLDIGSEDINKDVVDQFLNGDYSNGHRFRDIDQYRIENVCNNFIELCNR